MTTVLPENWQFIIRKNIIRLEYLFRLRLGTENLIGTQSTKYTGPYGSSRPSSYKAPKFNGLAENDYIINGFINTLENE